MEDGKYEYIIIGAGIAGAKAIEGIREMGKTGTILFIGNEQYFPYIRPALSKRIWTGEQKLENIFVNNDEFYIENDVEILIPREIKRLDVQNRLIEDDWGYIYKFGKLLIATGGSPKKLPIPGGDLQGICYYRYLDDYLKLRNEIQPGRRVTILGGGFIGTELAASFSILRADVTMIFPEKYALERVFPQDIADLITIELENHGVKVITQDLPTSVEQRGPEYTVRTKNGLNISGSVVVAGLGITPNDSLAKEAGIKTSNGIEVDPWLMTSAPNIYAAGDVAYFKYPVINEMTRIEHWDNAKEQGRIAGRNMAGANEPYNHIHVFYTNIYNYHFEASGDINSSMEAKFKWEKENERGIIYYIKDDKIYGIMTMNMPGIINEEKRKLGESLFAAGRAGR